jgi:hypothetical protein
MDDDDTDNDVALNPKSGQVAATSSNINAQT